MRYGTDGDHAATFGTHSYPMFIGKNAFARARARFAALHPMLLFFLGMHHFLIRRNPSQLNRAWLVGRWEESCCYWAFRMTTPRMLSTEVVCSVLVLILHTSYGGCPLTGYGE